MSRAVGSASGKRGSTPGPHPYFTVVWEAQEDGLSCIVPNGLASTFKTWDTGLAYARRHLVLLTGLKHCSYWDRALVVAPTSS